MLPTGCGQKGDWGGGHIAQEMRHPSLNSLCVAWSHPRFSVPCGGGVVNEGWRGLRVPDAALVLQEEKHLACMGAWLREEQQKDKVVPEGPGQNRPLGSVRLEEAPAGSETPSLVSPRFWISKLRSWKRPWRRKRRGTCWPGDVVSATGCSEFPLGVPCTPLQAVAGMCCTPAPSGQAQVQADAVCCCPALGSS